MLTVNNLALCRANSQLMSTTVACVDVEDEDAGAVTSPAKRPTTRGRVKQVIEVTANVAAGVLQLSAADCNTRELTAALPAAVLARATVLGCPGLW